MFAWGSKSHDYFFVFLTSVHILTCNIFFFDCQLNSSQCIYMFLLSVFLEGTYAVDEKDADLFSDTSSVTGQSVVSSLDMSMQSSQYSKSSG